MVKNSITKITFITFLLLPLFMVAKNATLGACDITINPKSEIVLPDETIQFNANESGDCATPCYSWEVTGSSGSTIDSNGLYTAGSTQGTDTVIVTDSCNGDISDTASVLISIDSDGDEILDAIDNCPNDYNPGQEDNDQDDLGDVCDPDDDNDDICDPGESDPLCSGSDNCQYNYNPDQANSDSDDLGNVCDNCWEVANPEQLDSNENCPALPYSTDPVCGDACEIIASDYYVATTGDDVGNDGLSPSSPFATIQHTIDSASGAQENTVTIHVAAGTYYENIEMDDFESLEGGWDSGFAQRWDFANDGVYPPAAYETIIDGNATSNCIKLRNLTSEDLFIDGFTITNGKACTIGNSFGRGSGIHCYASTLNIANCNITDNIIDAQNMSFGAGLFIYYNASATITNCIFSGNTINPYPDPGGVYYDYNGGGIHLNVNSSLTVTDCIFSGNSAERGGAIHIGITSNATITSCIFTENEAYNEHILGHYGLGGAINTLSPLTISNCIFTNNLAAGWGGAISDGGTSSTITNCIFAGNRSLNERKPPNWSDRGVGGALYNNNATSLGTITNCTFADNTAGENGGAITNYNGAHPTLINCIVWGNTAPTGLQIYNQGTSTATLNYCDIDQDGYEGSSGNIRQDPEFVGGGDYHLTGESPCIDAGTSDTAPITDLEGNARYDDPDTENTGGGTSPYYDIGALEYVSEVDADGDGIPDNDDNCPETPNGPSAGTCICAGEPCMSDGDCDCGSCSMAQEDTDNDGVGDVCDESPYADLCQSYCNRCESCVEKRDTGRNINQDACWALTKSGSSACTDAGCYWEIDKGMCLIDICLGDTDMDGFVSGSDSSQVDRDYGGRTCPSPSGSDLCEKYSDMYSICLDLTSAGRNLDKDECWALTKSGSSACTDAGCYWHAENGMCLIDICLGDVDLNGYASGGDSSQVDRDYGRSGCP